MNVIEIQPTPNPNAMKFVLDGEVSPQPISFLSPEAGDAHPLAKKLFAIGEIATVLLLNDFVTINKQPDAAWKRITARVKQVLAET